MEGVKRKGETAFGKGCQARRWHIKLLSAKLLGWRSDGETWEEAAASFVQERHGAEGAWGRGRTAEGEMSSEICRFQGDRDATMSIIEVSLLTGFYPNQDDLKQVTRTHLPLPSRRGCLGNMPHSLCGHRVAPPSQGSRINAPGPVATVTSARLPA